MKLFAEQTNESLLKCLECRLVGKPPKFNLQPPPMPPVEILQQLDINVDDLLKRKCLKLKPASTASLNDESSSDLAQSSASLVTVSTPFLLTSTQSFYIFIACLIVFFIVLFVACFFLIKLYRIKKQLDERVNSKSTSDLIRANRQHIFNCLSSSLTSSSASSTTSSNTINSNLILTPSNYITDSKSDKSSDGPLIYNQLFSYNSSNGSYYLQSIPASNSVNQTKLHNLDEYAEINSQTYHNRNIIYNQYDPRVQSVLNSNSSSSIESNSCHLAPLIQNNRTLANQAGFIFLNPALVNNNNINNDTKSFFAY